MNLLGSWSWFGSEVSHTTKVLTFFMAKLQKTKQKSKIDKKSLEITGGCVCEGEGAEEDSKQSCKAKAALRPKMDGCLWEAWAKDKASK